MWRLVVEVISINVNEFPVVNDWKTFKMDYVLFVNLELSNKIYIFHVVYFILTIETTNKELGIKFNFRINEGMRSKFLDVQGR